MQTVSELRSSQGVRWAIAVFPLIRSERSERSRRSITRISIADVIEALPDKFIF